MIYSRVQTFTIRSNSPPTNLIFCLVFILTLFLLDTPFLGVLKRGGLLGQFIAFILSPLFSQAKVTDVINTKNTTTFVSGLLGKYILSFQRKLQSYQTGPAFEPARNNVVIQLLKTFCWNKAKHTL